MGFETAANFSQNYATMQRVMKIIAKKTAARTGLIRSAGKFVRTYVQALFIRKVVRALVIGL